MLNSSMKFPLSRTTKDGDTVTITGWAWLDGKLVFTGVCDFGSGFWALLYDCGGERLNEDLYVYHNSPFRLLNSALEIERKFDALDPALKRALREIADLATSQHAAADSISTITNWPVADCRILLTEVL